jgi:hypothetical protein
MAGWPAPASAAGSSGVTVFNERFKGTTALANFSSNDGCVYAITSVFAVDGQSVDNITGHTSGLSAEVYDGAVDVCTSDSVVRRRYGEVDLAPGEFTYDKALDTAHLTASVPVYDYVSGTTSTLVVDVTWTAAAPAQQLSGTFHQVYPDQSVYTSRLFGAYVRSGAAGSVLDGQTNLTPLPTGTDPTAAELDAVNSGSHSLTV